MIETEGFVADTACTNLNPWCAYDEPHKHGSFACDGSCPCRRSSDSSSTGSEL